MATTVAKFIQAVAELILCFSAVVDESGFCGPAWKATESAKASRVCPAGNSCPQQSCLTQGKQGIRRAVLNPGGLWWSEGVGQDPIGLIASH